MVVLAVIGWEAVLSVGRRSLSRDVVHYDDVPTIFDDFLSSGDPAVLFLGNSLIREDIDAATFTAADDDRPDVFRVHPDDTSIVEWRYMADALDERSVGDGKRIVVCYAQNQLTDDSLIQPRRLGAHYLEAGTRRRMLSEDVTAFDRRAELFLSKMLYSFAAADRVRNRVLALIIPGYETTATRLLAGGRGDAGVGEAVDRDFGDRNVYRRLAALLDAFDAAGRPDVTFVAMPVGRDESPDPAAVELIRRRGYVHLDATDLVPITAADLPDGYHMDKPAAKRFTAALAETLD